MTDTPDTITAAAARLAEGSNALDADEKIKRALDAHRAAAECVRAALLDDVEDMAAKLQASEERAKALEAELQNVLGSDFSIEKVLREQYNGALESAKARLGERVAELEQELADEAAENVSLRARINASPANDGTDVEALKAQLTTAVRERDEARETATKILALHEESEADLAVASTENEALRAERNVFETEADKANTERYALREIISECVAALESGAGASPTCSLDFLKHAPAEVRETVKALRKVAREQSELATTFAGKLQAAEEQLAALNARALPIVKAWTAVVAPAVRKAAAPKDDGDYDAFDNFPSHPLVVAALEVTP